MKDLIIVGASGFGREVLGYAEACIQNGVDWQVKGFIDDNKDALKGLDYSVGVIGSISDWKPSENEIFVNGLGLPKVKKMLVESLVSRGARFVSLVHPSAIIGKNVKLGTGCVICPFCVLTCDIRMGNFVVLNALTSAGHDVKVGDWTTISSHCDLTGHVEVGEGVFFSSSSTTIPSSKIGDWSMVGINSSVVGKIKPDITVYGNPAHKI